MDFYIFGCDQQFLDYPQHSHGYWEIVLNVEGEGTAEIGGQNYDFHPGTIFCIRPGVPHSKHSQAGFVDWSVLIGDFCFQNEPGDVLLFEDDKNHSVEHLLQLAASVPEDAAADPSVEKYLKCLVDAIQNLLTYWKYMTQVHPAIRKLQRILDDHVSDPKFDLSAALAELPYSPNHCRKLFKDAYGYTPIQYLHQRKIQLAKELLLHHQNVLTVQEIAHQCGFEDPYYFSRVFKQITGVGPLRFVRQSRQLDRSEIATDFEENQRRR